MTKDSDKHVDHERNNLVEFKIILNLLNKICGIRETNHIMDIIISELIASTDSNQGVINLISSEDHKQLSTVVRVLDRNDNIIDRVIGESVAGWVIKNKQLLHVENLDDDDRFKGLTSLEGRYKSIICSPMIVRGDLIGFTTLIRNASKDPYNINHCKLVGIITSQTAQVLANAKLNEELAESNNLLKESMKKLKLENKQLKKDYSPDHIYESIIGKSESIKRVLTIASQCSFNDFSVLISGETGTGKELIARAIHNNSARKNKPFIVINCGVKTERAIRS
jgi:Nif-specific regulatory protein